MRGADGASPGQLTLMSVLQFAENLSVRAAVAAVRTRIDWKYALGLELDDPGFDHTMLCEFRARLVDGDAADRLLKAMLNRLAEARLLKAGGRQRTDATHDWRRCVGSAAWSWPGRACGPRLNNPPSSHRSGCCRWWSRSGTSATAAKWRSARFQAGRRG
ncbi:transposase [Streptomyces sp. NPDC050625]|uniref:transposase n=1 Tax=Streptomyces sp. NPDC050625 TaxID=3154629 RepID=UPI00342610E9